jgi:probable F420-dependent oxidoreductase
MRFGLALPHYDYSFPDGQPATFERILRYAQMAEDLGFDSVWISDHFFLSLARYGGPDVANGTPEALTVLAGIAARTERVRLGTLVLSAPLRHPAILAKSASAIDRISGGRLTLGLGAGWYESEFEAFGLPFAPLGDRFSMLEETLQVLGLLFEGDPIDHEGKHFRLEGAVNKPPAVQRPRPPILLGAKGGPRALSIAARLADAWNFSWRVTADAYRAKRDAADRACEKVGRDPSSLERSVGLYTLIGADAGDLEDRYARLQVRAPGGALDDVPLTDFARGGLVGTADDALEIVSRFADLGVSEMVVDPSSVPFRVGDDEDIRVFAELLLGEARTL